MSIDSKPFHPDTYIGPDQEDEETTDKAKESMTIKLKVENTMRWRWVKDENGVDVSLHLFKKNDAANLVGRNANPTPAL